MAGDRLRGKVALISGAARGIGLAAAQALCAEGAAVVIGDVLDAEGHEAMTALERDGADVVYQHLNVTEATDWRAAVQLADARFGGVDILVNNAAVYLGKAFEDAKLEEWQNMCAVNLGGVVLGIQAALPSLRRRAQTRPQGSAVINMSSVAGIVGSATDPLYSMTKGGITTFTKALAVDFGQRGYRIRVNSVHPGAVDTAMGRQTFASRARFLGVQDDDIGRRQAIAAHPIGRIGTVEDIARAIVYLASDDAGFVTGSSLVVDGGFTAR